MQRSRTISQLLGVKWVAATPVGSPSNPGKTDFSLPQAISWHLGLGISALLVGKVGNRRRRHSRIVPFSTISKGHRLTRLFRRCQQYFLHLGKFSRGV